MANYLTREADPSPSGNGFPLVTLLLTAIPHGELHVRLHQHLLGLFAEIIRIILAGYAGWNHVPFPRLSLVNLHTGPKYLMALLKPLAAATLS